MNVSRTQFQKIVWITVVWTIISVFIFLIGYGALLEYEFASQIDIMIPLKASIITGIIAGVLGGVLTVLIWEKWLRSKPYGWTIRNALITYSILMSAFLMVQP